MMDEGYCLIEYIKIYNHSQSLKENTEYFLSIPLTICSVETSFSTLVLDLNKLSMYSSLESLKAKHLYKINYTLLQRSKDKEY